MKTVVSRILIASVVIGIVGVVPVTFSLELDNGVICAEFLEDQTVGLTLQSLGRRGDTFRFRSLPPSESAAGLWQLVLRPDGGDEDVILRPEDSATVSVSWDPDGRGVLGFWNQVGAADLDDIFTVVLHARLEDDEPWIRWTISVERDEGASASLDSVRFPLTHWAAPVTPQGSQSLLEAQRRARVLVPCNGKGFISAGPLDMMASLGLSYDLKHPGPGVVLGQFIGWAALANMASTDPGYGRVLSVGCLDFDGYPKVFHHQWSIPSESVPAYTWWHDAHPAFNGNDPDGLDNTYTSPYPAITGVTETRTRAFWYSVVEPYRAAFEASPQAVPPIDRNPLLGVGRRPFWMTGHIQITPVSGGEELYRGFQAQADRIRTIFDAVGIDGAVPLSHWQTYLVDGGGVATPDFPVETTIDPGAPGVIQEMEGDGYTVSLYVYASGTAVDSNWYREYFSLDVPEARFFNRDGSVPDPNEMKFDLGHLTVGRYYVDHVIHDVLDLTGAGGIYLDTLTGTGAEMSYHDPDHAGHGGNYWMEGKRRFLQAAHEEVVTQAENHGKTEAESFVFSEAADEGVVGRLDITQDGYTWPPQLMRFYESTLFGTAPGVELDWSPPLWSAVYHEWMPTVQLEMPFSNAALADSPYQEGFEGIGAEEMLDLWSFLYGLWTVAGYRLELNDFTEYEDAPLVALDNEGDLIVDPDVDPDGAGLQVAAMLRRYWSAFDDRGSGPFLLRGRMLQPLDEDFSGEGIVLATNPLSHLSGTNPAHFIAVYPTGVMPTVDPDTGVVTQDPGASAMPVPAVLTSVWGFRGDTGIVTVNWTGMSSSHRAGLFPDEYFPPGSAFYLESPAGFWLGPFPTDGGRLDLRWEEGTGSYPDLFLGTLSPRSVRILRLRQAVPGDDDGNTVVETRDLRGIVLEVFDEDGTSASATVGGAHLGSPNDDIDGDDSVGAGDLAALIRLL